MENNLILDLQRVFPMQTLPQVPDKMQQILTTTADRAAIDSATFFWLANPDAFWFSARLTRQAIEQRFTPEAAATLRTTLEAAGLKHKGVYVQDSTWITLALHETWEGGRKKNHPNKSAYVATGTFEHFQLTDGITADSTAEYGDATTRYASQTSVIFRLKPSKNFPKQTSFG